MQPMPQLFRKSANKRERTAAAQAEIDRLKALSSTDLAALLLPALGSEGLAGGHSVRVQQLCDYLLRDFLPARQTQALQLMSRAMTALDRLERDDLVTSISLQRQPRYRITPEGEAALADGPVSRHLNRSE
jgi:hypothetical protein